MDKIEATILGGSGFSGAELIKLLAGHPFARLAAATSTTYEGRAVSDLYPGLDGLTELVFTKPDLEAAAAADLVFLALPHGQAHKLVPELRAAGPAKIIDLSGDFRLPADDYKKWYGQSHASPELLGEAVYGLTELNREAIAKASLIANPGCFPTGVILAGAPLFAGDLVKGDIIANCLTGVSGAGRAGTAATHFCRIDESAAAYKTGGAHQHTPEMEQALGPDARVSFTPILSPVSRGIYSIVTAELKSPATVSDLENRFADFYRNDHFVRILGPGKVPEMKATAGSNFCHIGLAVDKRLGRVTIVSAIDNLVKGASGQAVQNMNLMFGLEETAGLKTAGLYP